MIFDIAASGKCPVSLGGSPFLTQGLPKGSEKEGKEKSPLEGAGFFQDAALPFSR
jgi:hypothetical protein